MGSFSNTVFSILLGWIQVLVSMIWSAFTAEGGTSVLQFIGNNWILITVILCAVGLAADFTVYLFRWQPYKVWKTFWRHLKKKKENAAPDGSAEQEEPRFQEETVFRFSSNRTDPRTEEPDDDLERWRDKEELPEENQIPATVTPAGYVVPEDSPYRKPANRRRRRIRINDLLGDSDDGGELHYYAPRPVIDQKEAYHAPVYPENWTGGRGEDS